MNGVADSVQRKLFRRIKFYGVRECPDRSIAGDKIGALYFC